MRPLRRSPLPPVRLSYRARFLVAVLAAVSSAAPAGHARAPAGDGPPASATAPATAPAAYFGLTPPAETPELFAPGIINLPGRSAGHLAFSPDGMECFVTVFDGYYANSRMLHAVCHDGAWTPLRPVTFRTEVVGFEPLFSREGNRLYFTATTGTGKAAHPDFWMVSRTAEGWGEPRLLPPPLSSDRNQFCLTQAADGTMYFASEREGGRGGLDLYRTVAKPGQPLRVENLGAPVNTEFNDGDPAISPDGRTLVFYSVPNRPGVTGGSDLFICFADGRGGWTQPVNLGPGFNTPGDEYAATFSQDGRAFFFARFDGKHGEVHWVSTAALERFRRLP